MFSIRMYGQPVDQDKSRHLTVVIHFSSGRRPAVPFFLIQHLNGRTPVHTVAFAEDGEQVIALKEFSNPSAAMAFLKLVPVPIASALLTITSSSNIAMMFEATGIHPNDPSTTEFGNVGQAQAAYQTLLKTLRQM